MRSDQRLGRQKAELRALWEAFDTDFIFKRFDRFISANSFDRLNIYLNIIAKNQDSNGQYLWKKFCNEYLPSINVSLNLFRFANNDFSREIESEKNTKYIYFQ